MSFFAFGQPDLQFGAPLFPVHERGHQGVALALYRADELIQLMAVQQQFAVARGLRFDVGGCGGQGGDVRAVQIGFGLMDLNVAFRQADFAVAQAFDLPTLQREAGFQAIFDYTRPKTVWMNLSDAPLANPFQPR